MHDPTHSVRRARWRDPVLAESSKRETPSKGRRIFRRLAGLLALAGVVAGMLTWITPVPSPYFFPFWITTYENRLMPVVPGAMADEAAIAQGDFFPATGVRGAGGLGKLFIERDLRSLRQREPSDAVVLYLNAFASVGSEGNVQTYPADANPDRPDTSLLPLRAVLERLRECPAQQKLLILDIMRPFVGVRLGILSDNVGSAVHADLAAVEDPDRLTLCACSPGQVSLYSQILDRSVFGHYLEQGMRGWADGYGVGAKRDGRVSVYQLADFVATRVDRWAFHNRGTRQTPLLVGSADDFELFAIPRATPRSRKPRPKVVIASAPGASDGAETTLDATTASKNQGAAPAGQAKGAPATTKGGSAANAETKKAGAGGAPQAKDSQSAGASKEAKPSGSDSKSDAGKSGAGTGAAGADAKKADSKSANDGATKSDTAGAAKPAATDQKSVGASNKKGSPQRVLAYPKWLFDAWTMRDQWHDQKLHQVAPRIYRQLEAQLLRSEKRWIGGWPSDRVRRDLDDRVGVLKRRMALFAAIPRPQPRSLALSSHFGAEIDESIETLVADQLAKWRDQTATAKPADAAKAQAALVADFAKKAAGATPFQVAEPIFRLAASDPNPEAAEIQFLDALVRAHDVKPMFVETIFLQRIAALTGNWKPSEWPAQTVHQALRTVELSEQVVSHPETFPWIRAVHEQAFQAKHDGEWLLFYPGYAPFAMAKSRISEALGAFAALASDVETVGIAQQYLDEAYLVLPYYLLYVAKQPHYRQAWLAAADSTIDLFDSVRIGSQKDIASDTALNQRLEITRRESAVLRSLLDELLRPFDAANLTALEHQAAQPAATPIVYEDLVALRSVPFPTAPDRVQIWSAEARFAARSVEQTLDLDDREDRARIVSAPLESSHDAQFTSRRALLRRADLRAELGIELFRLGGLEPAKLNALQALLKKARDNPNDETFHALGQALRSTWAVDLPEQLAREKDVELQDRLGQAFYPFDPSTLLDDPARNPRRRLRIERSVALWSTLAETYRYLSHDTADATFYTEAARQYQQSSTPSVEPYLNISVTFGPPDPTAQFPAVLCTAELTLHAPEDRKVSFDDYRVLSAGEAWFEVVPDLTPLKALETPSTQPVRSAIVPFKILVDPTALSADGPLPRGLMVIVTVDGRAFHNIAPFPDPSPLAAQEFEVLFDTNPTQLKKPQRRLLLRPTGTPQEYFLYVANRTRRPRKLVVSVKQTGDEAVVATGTLALGPEQTSPVALKKPKPPAGATPAPAAPAPAPAAAPKAPAKKQLPAFLGPLIVELRDPDRENSLLRRLPVAVDLAAPREYVKVDFVEYRPAEAITRQGNQVVVDLHQTAGYADPPCVAELVFPPKRIPGLMAVLTGNLRGTLPADGSPLRLAATDIRLNPGASDDGYVYVTVDGQKRALLFDTTFSRWGDPGTPQEDARPAVRIDAARYAQPSKQYPVAIEVDSSPPAATLELRLGIPQGDQLIPQIVRRFPTARQSRIGFDPQGKKGGLIFEATIADWTAPLDTSGISGLRRLEASLLDDDDNVIATTSRPVELDNTPPLRVAFLDLPSQVVKGTTIDLQATGVDDESPIDKVEFFSGAPVMGKLPPMTKTIPAERVDPERGIWTAQFSLPKQAGKFEVSVQFTNRVGLSTIATAETNVLDAIPGGIIQGTVVEGARPQPGMEVILVDAKKKIVQKTKTGKDGDFTFQGVAPGQYKVAAAKPSTGRTGVVPLTVEAGKSAQVTIQLFL